MEIFDRDSGAIDYGTVLSLTESMRERIGEMDWEGLNRTGHLRESVLGHLRETDSKTELQSSDRDNKTRLLVKIIEINNEIEALVKNRIKDVQKELNTGKMLSRSYGYYSVE